MNRKYLCNTCGAVVDVPASSSLRTPSCPTCPPSAAPGNLVEIVSEQPSEAQSTTPIGRDQGTPTDVRLIPTGLLALALTAVGYYTIVQPIESSYVGQLLSNRGWVPYPIIYLTMWSMVILIVKYLRLRRQMTAIHVDILPEKLIDTITIENAYVIQRYLKSVHGNTAQNFLVNRIVRSLQHFRRRRDSREVAEFLRTQSDADLNAVEASYTMLKVFIWAVPILGFIGTVVGIGQAVDGFSQSIQSAQDFEVLKASLGSVTSGLAVAFDTTLLALVMSLVIMFPTSSMQKAEEDFLTFVEDYCNDCLLGRLAGAGTNDATVHPRAPAHADKLALEIRHLADQITKLAAAQDTRNNTSAGPHTDGFKGGKQQEPGV